MDIEPVLAAARQAKENGSTRFCMGAAWRDLAGRKRGFERILTMVREVRGMGMEVCTTLGMLSPEQARQLKEASVSASLPRFDIGHPDMRLSAVSRRTTIISTLRANSIPRSSQRAPTTSALTRSLPFVMLVSAFAPAAS